MWTVTSSASSHMQSVSLPTLASERAIPTARKIGASTVQHSHASVRDAPSALSSPKMGVSVVGIGASEECGLRDLGFEVSAFCEPDPEMNKFGRLAFPDAAVFNTLEEAMSDVEAIEKLLATMECVVLTLPCQNETALKNLNRSTPRPRPTSSPKLSSSSSRAFSLSLSAVRDDTSQGRITHVPSGRGLSPS